MLKLRFPGLQSVINTNIIYNIELFPDGLARRIDGHLYSLLIIGHDKISHMSVYAVTGRVISHTNLKF